MEVIHLYNIMEELFHAQEEEEELDLVIQMYRVVLEEAEVEEVEVMEAEHYLQEELVLQTKGLQAEMVVQVIL